MNNSQQNAVDLCKSPWVMDPITYELALQVLHDVTEHYQLEQKDQEKVQAAIIQLDKLYHHALTNYQPLKRQPRPE